MGKTSDEWKVDIVNGGIVIFHDTYGRFGFHPLDFTKENREKMIQALQVEDGK